MAPLFTGLRLGFGRSAEVAVAAVQGLTATGIGTNTTASSYQVYATKNGGFRQGTVGV